MDLYRETNIHPSILFSPPHFKGTFAVFPQGYFIMIPPVNKNLEKTRLLLIPPLLQLSIKE